MPLEVALFNTVKEYVESAPAARIYYRTDGRTLTVVAGMLSWKGKVVGEKEYEAMVGFLKDHDAIEVLSFRDVRELFS
ncbi:MAG TPA: hypothetical protein VJR06_01250 [Nitrososphaerales archaeon]|nr:hypothetical protein [Nitrososphaerales archaeon]